MDLINRTWKRLLIVVIFAGILSQGLSLLTAKKFEISALLLGIILYFALSAAYNRSQKK
jgi:hypothetical protein